MNVSSAKAAARHSAAPTVPNDNDDAERFADVEDEARTTSERVKKAKTSHANKEKAKAKDKDKPKDDDDDKDAGKKDKESKGTPKLSPASSAATSPAPPTPTHQRYTLHRDIFALRLAEHRRRRQAAQAKELAPRLPGAPVTPLP